MRLSSSLSLTSLILFACSTSAPNGASDRAASAPDGAVASSAEALQKLRELDARDVQKCRAVASRCAERSDAGSNPVCERISAHCDELEAQLAAARAELEQCLEEAVECEASAADPAQCEAARAACEPVDGGFRERRGRTLQCSDRARQCLAPGFGAGDAADAGSEAAAASAPVCDDEALDFVGCCRARHHGERADADAGVWLDGEFGRRPGVGFRPRPGSFPPPVDEASDAGPPRPWFFPPRSAQGAPRELRP